MRFDHLMHWVPDLDEAARVCAAMGFPPKPGGRIGEHLRNATWGGRDGTFVELISVVDLETWRRRSGPRGPLAPSREAAMRDGGGALQFAFEVDDLAATVAAVRGRGVRIGDPQIGSWQSATDGSTATWQAAWVDEGPGWRPFFIQYPPERAERRARQRAEGLSLPDWSFRRLDLETPDPDGSAAWLARVLGVTVGRAEGLPELPAHGCGVRLVPGPRDRVVRIVLEGSEGPVGHLFGVEYHRVGGQRSQF